MLGSSPGVGVRYIFVTGGVSSSLGKGLTSATIGLILQSMGFKVCVRKLDPYLNIDPGTMSPIQHGEVFVTDDGAETDLDLGHYERFTGNVATKNDSITAGKVYDTLLKKERKGDYLGQTVQVIPHVTDLIKSFIFHQSEDKDFIICEIGGTVGDIEGQPFLESIRQIGYEFGRNRVLFVHLTLVPYIAAAGELKTKPTQHSVKELNSFGISPDLILCRSEVEISAEQKAKIAKFCNVKLENVIPAIDLQNVYEVPLSYQKYNLDQRIMEHFGFAGYASNLRKLEEVVSSMKSAKKLVSIVLVGKYVKVMDSYKSLVEALVHGGLSEKIEVKITLIDSKTIDSDNVDRLLHGFDGIVVPGAFGVEGIFGKIEAIRYARENNIPFLGICVGMQLAVIEFARNVVGLMYASSEEITPSCNENVIVLTCDNDILGGSMRLGARDCVLEDGSKIKEIYGSNIISERHRHRYIVKKDYVSTLQNKGMKFTGFLPQGDVEVVELPDHRWFVCVQFHPEFKSTPFKPAPLFVSFIEETARSIV